MDTSRRDKEGEMVTNWVTQEDGTLVPNDVRLYFPSKLDGVYEIEFTCDSMGIVLETDFYGHHTIVKEIQENSSSIVKEAVRSGDVVVSINNHIVLDEEFEDIVTFLNVLRESNIPRRIRFLNPLKCPVAIYAERMKLQHKNQKDMYGFLRSVEYLQLERQHFASTIPLITARDREWVAYLKSIGGAENLKSSGKHRPSPMLKHMVRRGIPAAFRPLIWKHISLAARRQHLYPNGYYASLVEKIPALDAKVREDIEKDIDRTFPDHDYFVAGDGVHSLRKLLCVIALHLPDIGYCQSLNFIAGMILLFMGEEDAFWLMSTIVECLLPKDYYTKSMLGTYVDQFVFAHMVKTRYPELHRLLEHHQLQLSIVSIQWFMCLFVNTLRPEVALRVWDIFFNEGDKVLFRVAVALLKIHETEIFAAKDTSSLFMQLKDIGKNVIDADYLIGVAYKAIRLDKTPKNQPPSSLEGIGLAHVGPARASASLPAQAYYPSPHTPIKYQRSFDSFDDALNDEPPLQRNDLYRCFKRRDIDLWRNQFLPEVEERFRTMEAARQKWKQQHSTITDDEVRDSPAGEDAGSPERCNTSDSQDSSSSKRLRSVSNISWHSVTPRKSSVDDDDGVTGSPAEVMHDASPSLWNYLFEPSVVDATPVEQDAVE